MYVRREKGSGFATLPFTVSPEKENFFRKEVLVFGINNRGGASVIRLHLDGDMPVDADLDLSDVFKDFTADGISVDITVRVIPRPTIPHPLPSRTGRMWNGARE